MDDLNAALEVIDGAVKSTPHYYRDQGMYLNCLSKVLQSWFKWTGLMDNLNVLVEASN